VELDGLAHVAQDRVCDAEIAEAVAFAAPVADLAGDDETLLEELDSLARVTQVGVCEAEIAEGTAFSL
jgi:hypothetical protein